MVAKIPTLMFFTTALGFGTSETAKLHRERKLVDRAQQQEAPSIHVSRETQPIGASAHST